MLVEISASGSGLGHVLRKIEQMALPILCKGHSVYLNMPKKMNPKYARGVESENIFDLFIEQDFVSKDCDRICLGKDKQFVRDLETEKKLSKEEAHKILHTILCKTTEEVYESLDCWAQLPFCLGVHIRRGDAGRNRSPILPCPLYCELIDARLKENQLFYLATDSRVVADHCREHYGERVLMGDFVRRCDGKGIHQSLSSRSIRTAVEAYADFLALSLTSRLFCTRSRLSDAAQQLRRLEIDTFTFDMVEERLKPFLQDTMKEAEGVSYSDELPMWQNLLALGRATTHRKRREQLTEEFYSSWLARRDHE